MCKQITKRWRAYISGILLIFGLTAAISGQTAYPLGVSALSSWDITSDNSNHLYIIWCSGKNVYFGQIVNHAVTGQKTIITDAVTSNLGFPRLSVRPDGQTMSVIYITSGGSHYLKHAWRDSGGTWHTETVLGYSANGYWYPSGAVSGDGTVHALYAANYHIYYTYKRVGASWVSPIRFTSTTAEYGRCHMVNDPNGGIHGNWDQFKSYISYRYAANGHTLDEAATVYVYGPSGVAKTTGTGDIYVTDTGTVHQALGVYSYSKQCFVYHTLKPSGGSFSEPTCASVNPVVSDIEYYQATGADKNGRIFVSWGELVGGVNMVKLSAFEAGEWNVYTVDPLAAMNSNNKPAIAMTGQAGYLLWRHSGNELYLGEYAFSYVKINAPNGGETWYSDSSQNITWTASDVTDDVKLELIKGGTVLGTIASDLDIDSSPYAWTVGSYLDGAGAPQNAPSGSDYKVKISTMDDAYSDSSDSNFSITNPTLTVTAPNGGEYWRKGVAHAITWTTVGPITLVKLEYSTNGTDWNTIEESIANSGTYSWTIDGGATESTTCLVKVSDADDGSPQDTSNANFSILPASDITVTAPNGGEIWAAASAQNITWTTAGGSGITDVKIEYSLNNGGNWSTIVESTANDGLYLWSPLPVQTSGQCLVRISDAANASVNDESDKVFIIGAGSFSADFNKDGVSDILWRYYSTGGANRVWLMTHAAAMPAVPFQADNETVAGPEPDAISHEEMIADWQPANDATAEMAELAGRITSNGQVDPMQPDGPLPGVSRLQSVNLPALSNIIWQMSGAGDFNKDGKPDILWRFNGTGGKNQVWLMNGYVRASTVNLPAITDIKWKIVGAGDFNQDGYMDILWEYQGTGGYVSVWLMEGTTRKSIVSLPAVADLNWKIVGCGDFNQDGHVDILWRQFRTGANVVWLMDGLTKGSGETIDSVTDLRWQIVGCGDFNKDGMTDIIWRFNSTGGSNVIWLMNGLTKTSGVTITAESNLKWKIENN